MIIDCISDLHGFYPKLEGGDLLIIAGDLTARDELNEMVYFADWVESLKYTKIVFIAGNHDNTFEEDPLFPESGLFGTQDRIEYLCDSGTEFTYQDPNRPEEDEGFKPSGKRTYKIWGTPHSLLFKGINPKCCAFTGTEDDLKKKYDLIPDDIDILISHSPAYGLLDENINGEHCGSKSLLEAIERIKPTIFVHGHIHERGSTIQRIIL